MDTHDLTSQAIQTLAAADDGRIAPQAQPPVIGEAAPLLDIEGGNVPNESERPLPTWNKKQWGIRQTVLTRLRYWQHHGF